MKSLDVEKIYEFTGVPMDKRWAFIAFYLSTPLEPVETPERERRAEQGGADQPATAPEVKSEGKEKGSTAISVVLDRGLRGRRGF
jgi:hypothetical protein